MAEPQAVTLWLLKRGREMVFDLGLGYLAARTYFAGRGGPRSLDEDGTRSTTAAVTFCH